MSSSGDDHGRLEVHEEAADAMADVLQTQEEGGEDAVELAGADSGDDGEGAEEDGGPDIDEGSEEMPSSSSSDHDDSADEDFGADVVAPARKRRRVGSQAGRKNFLVDDGTNWLAQKNAAQRKRDEDKRRGLTKAPGAFGKKKKKKKVVPVSTLYEEMQARKREEADIYGDDDSSSDDGGAAPAALLSPRPAPKKRSVSGDGNGNGDDQSAPSVRVYQEAAPSGEDVISTLFAAPTAVPDDAASPTPEGLPGSAAKAEVKRGKKRNRHAERVREQKRLLAQHTEESKILRSRELDITAMFGAAREEDQASLADGYNATVLAEEQTLVPADFRLNAMLEDIDQHTRSVLPNTMRELPEEIKRDFRGGVREHPGAIDLVVLPEPKTHTVQKLDDARESQDDEDYVPSEDGREDEDGVEEEDAEEALLGLQEDEEDEEERRVDKVLAGEGIQLPKTTLGEFATMRGDDGSFSEAESQSASGEPLEEASDVDDDVPDTPVATTPRADFSALSEPAALTQPDTQFVEDGDVRSFEPAELTQADTVANEASEPSFGPAVADGNQAKSYLAELQAMKDGVKQVKPQQEESVLTSPTPGPDDSEGDASDDQYETVTAADIPMGNDTGSEEESDHAPENSSKLRRDQFQADSECEVSDDVSVSSDEHMGDQDVAVVDSAEAASAEDEDVGEGFGGFGGLSDEDEEMAALLRITSGNWRKTGAVQETAANPRNLRDLVFQDDGADMGDGELLGDRDPATGRLTRAARRRHRRRTAAGPVLEEAGTAARPSRPSVNSTGSPAKNSLFREFSIGAFRREEATRRSPRSLKLQEESASDGESDDGGPRISAFTRHQKRKKLLSSNVFGADPDALLMDDPVSQQLLQMMGRNEPDARATVELLVESPKPSMDTPASKTVEASPTPEWQPNPPTPRKARLKRNRSFARITDNSKFELEAQRAQVSSLSRGTSFH